MERLLSMWKGLGSIYIATTINKFKKGNSLETPVSKKHLFKAKCVEGNEKRRLLYFYLIIKCHSTLYSSPFNLWFTFILTAFFPSPGFLWLYT